MKSLKELQDERDDLINKAEKVQYQINNRLAKTIVKCEDNNFGKGCGMGFEIGELVYIQTHWYEEPYSCNGGDTWHQGEGNWKCHKCGHRNRLYDKPEIQELKRLFADVLDEYNRR